MSAARGRTCAPARSAERSTAPAGRRPPAAPGARRPGSCGARRVVRLPALALLLASLVSLAGCRRGPGRGIVVLHPPDPARPTYHDFGTVSYGEMLEHVFQLANTGPDPVTFLSWQGACSCTSVRDLWYERPGAEPVHADLESGGDLLELPGDAPARLKIRLDTTKVTPNADKLAILRVRTDSPATPFLTFELHVRAQRLFRLQPASLRLGEVPTSHGGAGVARLLTAERDSPARVLGIARQGERVHARLEETPTGDETLWSVHIEVPPLTPLGVVRDRVVLETTGADGTGSGPPLEIEVWAEVVEDVRFQPRQIRLGTVEGGEQRTAFEGRLEALVPGQRVRVVEASVEGSLAGHVTVTAEPLAPDAVGRSPEWTIRLSAGEPLPAGPITADLHLVLDDEQVPEVRVPIVGQVR